MDNMHKAPSLIPRTAKTTAKNVEIQALGPVVVAQYHNIWLTYTRPWIQLPAAQKLWDFILTSFPLSSTIRLCAYFKLNQLSVFSAWRGERAFELQVT